MDSKFAISLALAVLVSGAAGYAGGMMQKQSIVDQKQSKINTLEQQASSAQDNADNLEQQVSQLETERDEAEINAFTPADDLRVGLNADLREHVTLGLNALRNAYDGDEDTTASVNALDENSKELAAKVGSVYGDQAESDFLALWRAHIGYFKDYTVGLKTDNQTKRQIADENLKGYAQNAGTFFNDANPNIPKDAVVSLAEEHKTLVIASMKAYDEGNYEKAYKKQREAEKQVRKIANALTKGIVKQNPDVFRPEN